MHWFLIIGAIVIVVVVQIVYLSKTLSRLKVYKKIFPSDPKDKWTVYKHERSYTSIITLEEAELTQDIEKLSQEYCEVSGDSDEKLQIQKKISEKRKQIKSSNSKIENDVQKSIIDSINRYLEKNGESASDFNLIKDIVDRNTDSVDEEIQTQIPFPLYLGLMGTMTGILIGVGYLVISGGINDLVNTVNIGDAQTEGISALLGGVALAMIGSIFGIIFTIIGSNKSKNIKVEVEEGKHKFLSWLQAELLPIMNRDAVSVMRQVTENLSEFNRVFTQNTQELGNTLETVNDTTENQVRLIEQVNQLHPVRLARANIEVYENLRNCSDEIGRIGEMLQDSSSYLQHVKDLSDRLDQHEALYETIQQMNNFFRATQDGMAGMISKSIGTSEERLGEATRIFQQNIENSYNSLTSMIANHQISLDECLRQENDILGKRIAEFTTLVNEIRNLSSVKSSVDELKRATEAQNSKLDELSKAIKNLAQTNVTGAPTTSKLTLPKFAKIALYICGGVLTLAGLFFDTLIVMSLLGIL